MIFLKIIYTKSYISTYKKLKNHIKEKEKLDIILLYISSADDFNYIKNDSLAKVYNFERLKHNLNEFYSFRLSKLFRLIVRPTNNGIEVELVYISSNHYDDFNKDKVRL